MATSIMSSEQVIRIFLAGFFSALLFVYSTVSLYQGFMFPDVARLQQEQNERLLGPHNKLVARETSPPLEVNTSIQRNDTDERLPVPFVEMDDIIFNKYSWYGAPIVIEELKLVFFTQAKVGSTTWLHLFRRIMGFQDWNVEEYEKMLPWNPGTNGVNYLHHYNRGFASYVMASPDWTRAIFVRDPKERLLSAFLDKGFARDGDYIRQRCCPEGEYCWTAVGKSLQDFLNVIRHCDDDNWRPQALRIDSKYWPFINFVGHLESVAEDAERLLRQLGAWEKYGQFNWGKAGPIFRNEPGGLGRLNPTNARDKLKTYMISAELEGEIEDFYQADYQHPVLDLPMRRIFK